MTVHLLAEVEISDPDGMQRYLDQVDELTERMGGSYQLRGPVVDILEGDDTFRPDIAAVIAFDTAADVRRWYECDEYQPLKELRLRSGRTRMTVLDGAPG